MLQISSFFDSMEGPVPSGFWILNNPLYAWAAPSWRSVWYNFRLFQAADRFPAKRPLSFQDFSESCGKVTKTDWCYYRRTNPESVATPFVTQKAMALIEAGVELMHLDFQGHKSVFTTEICDKLNPKFTFETVRNAYSTQWERKRGLMALIGVLIVLFLTGSLKRDKEIQEDFFYACTLLVVKSLALKLCNLRDE